MQKPKYFRVTIPVVNKIFVERIREFVEGLNGSEVAFNFGEQRNKKEFKYLVEKSEFKDYRFIESKKEKDDLILVFRQKDFN